MPELPILAESMLPVLDLLPDAVTVSRDGRILFANLAAVEAIGARCREEVLDHALEDLVVPEERPVVAERVRTQQQGNRLPAIEYRGLTLDGRRVVVEVHVNPVLFDGRPAMLALVRDITLRRKAEEELQRTQKLDAVGRMAGGIAHDFNSLLAIIHGNAELFLAGSPLAVEEQEDLVRQIHQASSRAAVMVRRLLSFSRMRVHNPARVDLADLVRGFLPMLHRLLGDEVRVQEHLAPGLPPVQADAGQVEQVLLNLVLNARDAMPHGGTVRIEVSEGALPEGHPSGLPAGRYAVLCVCDDGCGMDEATATQATEPFFTTKESGRGTGLGLSTVVDILRQHRGGLTLDTRPGEGTRATAWLPLAEAWPPAEARGPEGSSPGGNESILLVDDEPILREVLRRGLVRAGFRVVQAASGEQALQVVASEKVDAVVTDIVMPGLTGLDLAERLERLYPDLPIILITGYTDRVPEREGRPLPLLVKPFRLGQLTESLREVLDAKALGART